MRTTKRSILTRLCIDKASCWARSRIAALWPSKFGLTRRFARRLDGLPIASASFTPLSMRFSSPLVPFHSQSGIHPSGKKKSQVILVQWGDCWFTICVLPVAIRKKKVCGGRIIPSLLYNSHILQPFFRLYAMTTTAETLFLRLIPW